MATKIEICNKALSCIGNAKISGMDEQNNEARTCKQFYDTTRRDLLSSFAFSFATKRKRLELSGEENLTKYRYMYDLPTDCIKSLEICQISDNYVSDVDYDYIIEGKYIYTDCENAVLVYTYDCIDTNMFSPRFVEIFSHILGANIGLQLGKDRKLCEYLRVVANELYKNEAKNDVISSINVPIKFKSKYLNNTRNAIRGRK